MTDASTSSRLERVDAAVRKAIDSNGNNWIADAHRDNEKRFVVPRDQKGDGISRT
jgi:hypothetical protein